MSRPYTFPKVFRDLKRIRASAELRVIRSGRNHWFLFGFACVVLFVMFFAMYQLANQGAQWQAIAPFTVVVGAFVLIIRTWELRVNQRMVSNEADVRAIDDAIIRVRGVQDTTLSRIEESPNDPALHAAIEKEAWEQIDVILTELAAYRSQNRKQAPQQAVAANLSREQP